MKIVGVSNFDLDNVSDMLLCENIKNEYMAKKICELFNSDDSDYFYEIKPDDYKLYEWEP